ncbi:8-oxo-dGTP diphosphatase MutT [Calderihabitans maritimus]|uniref:8-oxo-dGTP diphosphatase n=1 Tax=Calderihabitans maritimus TaxID=1246530 RepID=A0A1Z5HN68_9FIRM|nr:8-oxo-dGTP diphosphatase MutT [Calderihabitans maritimus]GAW90966.1 NUDIX hydrolase [Calderihabitans maritimus]
MIVVTAALIKANGKILIAQRPAGSYMGLKWEFPGGKVEEGEHPQEALRRELREELGIEVEVRDIFEVVSHKYKDRHILLLCYQCRLLSRNVTPREGQSYRWVTKEELDNYEFTEADKPIVNKLRKTP